MQKVSKSYRRNLKFDENDPKRYKWHGYRWEELENIWRQLARLIPACVTEVLEFGCGGGEFAEILLQERPDVAYFGYDVVWEYIMQARNRNLPNATFSVQSMYDILLDSRSSSQFLISHGCLFSHVDFSGNDVALRILDFLPSRFSFGFITVYTSRGKRGLQLQNSDVIDRHDFHFGTDMLEGLVSSQKVISLIRSQKESIEAFYETSLSDILLKRGLLTTRVVIILVERLSFDSSLLFTAYLREMVSSCAFRPYIIRNPKQLLHAVSEAGSNLAALYLMQDCIGDSYLLDMTMEEAKRYLKSLDVPIFPAIKDVDYINSKLYTKDLEETRFGMPKSAIFVDSDAQTIEAHFNKLQAQDVHDIVLKKGWSYEGMQIARVNLSKTFNLNEILQSLKIIRNWGNRWELDRYHNQDVLIIQPFNEHLPSRKNEYRCFFLEGEFIGYFAHGVMKNGRKVASELFDSSDEIHCIILDLASSCLNEIVRPKIGIPSIIRVDVSFCFVDGKKVWYVNELEVQPSFYFHLPGVDTKPFQKSILRVMSNLLNATQ